MPEIKYDQTEEFKTDAFGNIIVEKEGVRIEEIEAIVESPIEVEEPKEAEKEEIEVKKVRKSYYKRKTK